MKRKIYNFDVSFFLARRSWDEGGSSMQIWDPFPNAKSDGDVAVSNSFWDRRDDRSTNEIFVIDCSMIRAIALPVTFFISATIALAVDQPGNSDEPGEFDIEPPILKQNLSDELAESGTPDGDVARCEKKLEQAKRSAAGAERLWKIGVLAKIE